MAKAVSGTVFDIVFNKYLDIVHSRGQPYGQGGTEIFMKNAHVDIAPADRTLARRSKAGGDRGSGISS